MAKATSLFALIGRTESIAAIFNQPELVAIRQGTDFFGCEGVAKGVGEHDGPGLFGDCRFDGFKARVVGRDLAVDKDRNQIVLQYRIDCGGKSGGGSDDLISRLQCPVTQQGRCQRGQCKEIGAGARVAPA